MRFCGACGTELAPAAAPRQVRKTVTIVFCDVSGSTALGERLDPEALRRTMGRYFEEIRAVVERHGGLVEKFIGDAVMAVFGIPTAHEDDAVRAVRAVAEMRERLQALGEELAVSLSFRTGVNTGEVVAGEGETLVTGDAVNVAARFEQAAAAGEILIGAETYRLVRNAVTVEAVEPLELKGKAEPVPAYRLVAVDPLAPGSARHLDVPIVGRVREQSRLLDDFEDVVSGRVMPPVHAARSGRRGQVAARAAVPLRRRRTRRSVEQPLPPLRRRHHVLAARRDADPDGRRAGCGHRRVTGGDAARLSAAPRRAGHASASDLAPRRPALGRGAVPGSGGAHRRLVARRPDPAALRRPPGAARATSGLGRRQAQRHHDPARAALGRGQRRVDRPAHRGSGPL